MTSEGGAGYVPGGNPGGGTIFSIPVAGGTPTVLASFSGRASPSCDLTLVGSTLYGVSYGGAYGYGAIFSMPVSGGPITTVASFNGTDGGSPNGLTLVGSTFYGATSDGGAYNDGTIFSFPLAGGAITSLFSFNGADGQFPTDAGLTLGPNGSALYGVTYIGGANGAGTLYELNLLTPEPSSSALFGLGALALAAAAARQKMRRRAASIR